MRKQIIAGNWKMNGSIVQTEELISALVKNVAGAGCEVVVCVPYTLLATASKALSGTNIALGAQNVSTNESGAFTGEISPSMLKEFNVQYAIIGHSERRSMYGETDESVNLRVKNALKNGIKPIICVGESLFERESGYTDGVVTKQTRLAFEGVSCEEIQNCVVAYEPIWAIGTGMTATSEQANDTIRTIRRELARLFGEAGNSIRIQYGGSMNAKNASELLSMSDIDGGLIGGASLKAEDFTKIIESTRK